MYHCLCFPEEELTTQWVSNYPEFRSDGARSFLLSTHTLPLHGVQRIVRTHSFYCSFSALGPEDSSQLDCLLYSCGLPVWMSRTSLCQSPTLTTLLTHE